MSRVGSTERRESAGAGCAGAGAGIVVLKVGGASTASGSRDSPEVLMVLSWLDAPRCPIGSLGGRAR